MTVFCFLWIPIFYLFRRSTQDNIGSGGVWALLLGSFVALIQFLLGDLVNPGGFGLSRWINAWVDIVALPVILPLLVYFFFIIFKITTGTVDFANFTLLWLIPGAGIRAVSWSSAADPVYLVLVPLLWTALAMGIPFFIQCIMNFSQWFIRLPFSVCIMALPFLAATSWWAFYAQKFWFGMLFLALSIIPLAVSVVISWQQSK